LTSALVHDKLPVLSLSGSRCSIHDAYRITYLYHQPLQPGLPIFFHSPNRGITARRIPIPEPTHYSPMICSVYAQNVRLLLLLLPSVGFNASSAVTSSISSNPDDYWRQGFFILLHRSPANDGAHPDDMLRAQPEGRPAGFNPKLEKLPSFSGNAFVVGFALALAGKEGEEEYR